MEDASANELCCRLAMVLEATSSHGAHLPEITCRVRSLRRLIVKLRAAANESDEEMGLIGMRIDDRAPSNLSRLVFECMAKLDLELRHHVLCCLPDEEHSFSLF